jgi:large subunit ribosomal protein L43
MYSREQINQWLEFHRTRNGNEIVRLMEPSHTENPSVQGVWTPFTNKPFEAATRKYPIHHYLANDIKPTATQKIIELFEKQRQLSDAKNVSQVK